MLLGTRPVRRRDATTADAARCERWKEILIAPMPLQIGLVDVDPRRVLVRMTELTSIPMTVDDSVDASVRVTCRQKFGTLDEFLQALAEGFGCNYTLGPSGVVFTQEQ